MKLRNRNTIGTKSQARPFSKSPIQLESSRTLPSAASAETSLEHLLDRVLSDQSTDPRLSSLLSRLGERPQRSGGLISGFFQRTVDKLCFEPSRRKTIAELIRELLVVGLWTADDFTVERVAEEIDANPKFGGLVPVERLSSLFRALQIVLRVSVERARTANPEQFKTGRELRLQRTIARYAKWQFGSRSDDAQNLWEVHQDLISEAAMSTLVALTADPRPVAEWPVEEFDLIHTHLLDGLESLLGFAFPELEVRVGTNFMHFIERGSKHWPSITRRLRSSQSGLAVYGQLYEDAESILLVGPTSSSAASFRDFGIPMSRSPHLNLPGAPRCVLFRQPVLMSVETLERDGEWPDAVPVSVRHRLIEHMKTSRLASCISIPVLCNQLDGQCIGVVNINSDGDLAQTMRREELAILERLAAPILQLIGWVEVLHRNSEVSQRDHPRTVLSPDFPADRSSENNHKTKGEVKHAAD